MTICFEVDGRCNWKPGSGSNPIMWRGWWLWFAVCIVKIPFERFATDAHDWRIDGRRVRFMSTELVVKAYEAGGVKPATPQSRPSPRSIWSHPAPASASEQANPLPRKAQQ